MYALRVRYDEDAPWVYIGPWYTEREAKAYKKKLDKKGYAIHIIYIREPVHK